MPSSHSGPKTFYTAAENSAYLHRALHIMINYCTKIYMEWKELLLDETLIYNIWQLTDIAVSQLDTQPESPILKGELISIHSYLLLSGDNYIYP